MNTLHSKIIEVCGIACDTLADSDQFPENWLMKHRWDKGKKNANTLPTGEKIIHIKVGGRTSAVVPSVQKKTGPVAGDGAVEEQEIEALDEAEEDTKPVNKKVKANGAKSLKKSAPTTDTPEPKTSKSAKRKAPDVKAEEKLEDKAVKKSKAEVTSTADGRRRSTRRT